MECRVEEDIFRRNILSKDKDGIPSSFWYSKQSEQFFDSNIFADEEEK